MAKLGNLHVQNISLDPLLSWQSIVKNENLIDLDIYSEIYLCEILAQFWKRLKKVNCKILMCEKYTYQWYKILVQNISKLCFQYYDIITVCPILESKNLI